MARGLKDHYPFVGDTLKVQGNEIDAAAIGASHIKLATAPSSEGQLGVATGRLQFYTGGAAKSVKYQDDVATLTHLVHPANMMVASNATPAALTRNAVGDWSLNVTAGGAENHYFAVAVPLKSTVAGKGVKLSKISFAYELGVVAATSVDVTSKKVTFAQATEPAVTGNGGNIVDGSYDESHNTAAERADQTVANGEHVLTVTLPTPGFMTGAGAMVVAELAVVLANTGTLKVRAAELEYVYAEPTA